MYFYTEEQNRSKRQNVHNLNVIIILILYRKRNSFRECDDNNFVLVTICKYITVLPLFSTVLFLSDKLFHFIYFILKGLTRYV